MTTIKQVNDKLVIEVGLVQLEITITPKQITILDKTTGLPVNVENWNHEAFSDFKEALDKLDEYIGVHYFNNEN